MTNLTPQRHSLQRVLWLAEEWRVITLYIVYTLGKDDLVSFKGLHLTILANESIPLASVGGRQGNPLKESGLRRMSKWKAKKESSLAR